MHKFLPPKSTKTYQKLVAETTPVYSRGGASAASSYEILKISGDLRDWQIRCVCGKNCNNGWMREKIEDPARSIFTKLILGERPRLLPPEKKAIAAWAALKAMVAEFDGPSQITTHHSQRKYLMSNLEPPRKGWAIWIGCISDTFTSPAWRASPFLYLSEKQERRRKPNIRATHYNGAASTQIISNIVLHVLRSPAHDFVDRWGFRIPSGGSIFKIWPPSELSIQWPGRPMTIDDAEYVSEAVSNHIVKMVAPKVQRGTIAGNTPLQRARRILKPRDKK